MSSQDTVRRHVAGGDGRTGFYLYVFGERQWFANREDAQSEARRATGVCPARLIELRCAATNRVLSW
jgi:hypothetical protein